MSSCDRRLAQIGRYSGCRFERRRRPSSASRPCWNSVSHHFPLSIDDNEVVVLFGGDEDRTAFSGVGRFTLRLHSNEVATRDQRLRLRFSLSSMHSVVWSCSVRTVASCRSGRALEETSQSALDQHEAFSHHSPREPSPNGTTSFI